MSTSPSHANRSATEAVVESYLLDHLQGAWPAPEDETPAAAMAASVEPLATMIAMPGPTHRAPAAGRRRIASALPPASRRGAMCCG